jgi:capsular exopolysaccharide synthesis family protein
MREDMRTYYHTQLQIIKGRPIMERAAQRMQMTSEEVEEQLVRFEPGYAEGASIMVLEVDAYSPDFAQRYVNVVAQEYIQFKQEQLSETATSAAIQLSREVKQLGEELRDAQDRLFEFKRRNNEVLIAEQGDLAAHYLAQLRLRAAQLSTERTLLEAQEPKLRGKSTEEVRDLLTSMGSFAPSPLMPSTSGSGAEIEGDLPADSMSSVGGEPVGVLSSVDTFLASVGSKNGTLLQLRRTYEQLNAELIDASSKYKDKHPELIKLKAALARVDRQIQIETDMMLDRFSDQIESIKIQENTLEEALNKWEIEALAASEKSADYARLANEVRRIESIYEVLVQRLKEIDVSTKLQTDQATIFEEGQVDLRPVAPKKLALMVFAGMFGLGLGVILVFFIEYIDDSIRFPEEVEEGLGIPFFGVIPAASWDQEDLRSHLLINLDPKAGLSEAYRNIRSAILFNIPGDEPTTIVITSSIPREGKTTTSTNLAISFAQAGSSVLLVDCDMRRGRIHKFFNQPQDRGLSDVLGGSAKAEAVTRRTGVNNLDLLTTGEYPDNPAELLLSPEMKEFLAWAGRAYDKVILDCPPAMAVSDAGIVGSMVDACIFVVWAGQTSRRVAMASKAILETRGARIAGCILNNLEFGRVGYYYYSTYYNYYDYGYRYEDQPGRPDEMRSAPTSTSQG